MRVNLIVEDSAHELFLRPMIIRLGKERNVTPFINTISAVGGRPRVLEATRIFETTNKALGEGLPDSLIVATDGNCVGFVARRNEVTGVLSQRLVEFATPAVPDPHIERWLLADPEAFRAAVGLGVQPPQRKC